MAVWQVTGSNWNEPKFWASIQPSGDGHALDFEALGRDFSVVLDRGGGRLTISDGKTTFVVTDSMSKGGDAALGPDTRWSQFQGITGTDGADRVEGTRGDDTLDGQSGDDSVRGGAGDDLVYGNGGADSIDGGDGHDTVFGGAGDDSIVGGAGDDRLFGETGDDTIFGGDGDDTLVGGDGHDSLDAGEGRDSVSGGAGDDTILARGGNNTLDGGAGNDSIVGSSGDDTIFGGDGADTIVGGGGRDSVSGGEGDDSIVVSGAATTVDGGAGDDTIWGGADADRILGGTGADVMHGGAGSDTFVIENGFGDDTIYGGDGAGETDTIDASALSGPVTVIFTGDRQGTITDGTHTITFYGIERFVLTENADVVDGTADTAGFAVEAGGGADSIMGGAGDDTLVGGDGADTIDGGAGDDSLGGARGIENGNDVIRGGDGADTIDGGFGRDDIDGGAGDDMLYEGSVGGADGDVSGGAGNDTIYGGTGGADDSLVGGAGDDLLVDQGRATVYGTSDDTLDGGAGADTLEGGDGDNVLIGGAGDDLMRGGGGADTFVFATGSGADTISDYDTGDADGDGAFDDRLDVSGLSGGSGPGGVVTAWDVRVEDDGAGNARLVFPQGESVVLQGVAPATMQGAANLARAGIPCYAPGTLIETGNGPLPVERLRAGMRLAVPDGGLVRVLWTGARRLDAADLAARPELRPVVIRPRALGNARRMVVSPQHAFLVRGVGAGRAGGAVAGDRLVRARHLAEFCGGRIARVDRRAEGVTYHHVLAERHSLIRAEGAVTETLYPGPMALRGLGAHALAGLLAACPQLAPGLIGRADIARLYGPPARPYATRADLRASRVALPGRAREASRG